MTMYKLIQVKHTIKAMQNITGVRKTTSKLLNTGKGDLNDNMRCWHQQKP